MELEHFPCLAVKMECCLLMLVAVRNHTQAHAQLTLRVGSSSTTIGAVRHVRRRTVYDLTAHPRPTARAGGAWRYWGGGGMCSHAIVIADRGATGEGRSRES